MQFGLNYSHKAAELVRAGEIEVDTFKCPAWPELIETARALRHTYVHFPLVIGAGFGDAIDSETNLPADWRKVETLLKLTETRMVNVHLAPRPQDFPEILQESTRASDVARIAASAIRDVHAVVARFGADKVIVENEHVGIGTILRAGTLPEVVLHVVNETGCGMLLDLSHARLAADDLGMDRHEYIERLPVQRIREIHVTGIQRVDERWLSIGDASSTPAALRAYAGRLLDHLPMTDSDWAFMEWALAQVRDGEWSTPWVMTCEYGGVSGAWEAVTFTEVLKMQVPQFRAMVNRGI